MANRYTFKNGISILVSDTIMESIYKYALLSPKSALAHCQALLDFVHSKKSHIGEKVGNWINAIQEGVRRKPYFIVVHVVDVAYNAGKYIEVLEWQTQGERLQKIVTAK